MNRIILLVALIFVTIGTNAQILKPAKWTFSSTRVKEGIYELHMKVDVENGWTTYSQGTPAGGPSPTKIVFNKNKNLLLGGKAKEIGEMKKKHEVVFDVEVHYFENKVDFVQLLKLKTPKKTSVSGYVRFMVCDDEQCITENVPFKVELN